MTKGYIYVYMRKNESKYIDKRRKCFLYKIGLTKNPVFARIKHSELTNNEGEYLLVAAFSTYYMRYFESIIH